MLLHWKYQQNNEKGGEKTKKVEWKWSFFKWPEKHGFAKTKQNKKILSKRLLTMLTILRSNNVERRLISIFQGFLTKYYKNPNEVNLFKLISMKEWLSSSSLLLLCCILIKYFIDWKEQLMYGRRRDYWKCGKPIDKSIIPSIYTQHTRT